MESSVLVPPELSEGESYHIFCSFSSIDYDWTHALIQQLEARGLRVCDHERDFIAGRSILENMTESIQESQKVMLVLSAEFLRSRWCLLEANMSMFRDSLQRKPIVPVLLQRDVSIPLHLSHLTYLDVQNPDFIQQLLKVLCTTNQELQSSTVPYMPSLYNGKALKPLPAVNEGRLTNKQPINKFDCGVWSNMVPDQLSLIIHRPERYRKAISLINTVSQEKVRFRSCWKRLLFAFGIALCFGGLLAIHTILINLPYKNNALIIVSTVLIIAVIIYGIYELILFIKNEGQRIIDELQKAIGQANSLLLEEKVLIGSESNSRLLLVYVSVDACRQELSAQSQDDQHFHEVLLKYSCAYTCCLAKRHFTFRPTSDTGHLEGTVCFCQYVNYQLSVKETKRFCQWIKHYS